MSETASQEPTMEEILASIRRIISEDEPAAEAPATPEAGPEPLKDEPAPLAETALEAAAEDDVLELTEPLEQKAEPAPAPPTETIGDLDVYHPEPQPSAKPVREPAPEPAAQSAPADEEALVSASTADAAASAFSQLAHRVAMPSPAQTLDEVVRELLRPLLKDWLDRNLPGIVQAKVEEEVERLARRRLS